MKTEIPNKLEEALNAIHDARLMSKDGNLNVYLAYAKAAIEKAKERNRREQTP